MPGLSPEQLEATLNAILTPNNVGNSALQVAAHRFGTSQASSAESPQAVLPVHSALCRLAQKLVGAMEHSDAKSKLSSALDAAVAEGQDSVVKRSEELQPPQPVDTGGWGHSRYAKHLDTTPAGLPI